MKGFGLYAGFSLVLYAILAPSIVLAQGKVPVTVMTFPGDHYDDGFWTSILAASDGRVYVGLCMHSGSANMYLYEPASKEIRHLASMQEAAHEIDLGREPQSKLHSQIREDRQGKIWWGTDMGVHSYLNQWDSPLAHPGGHIFRYDPKTDHLDDLGIPFPGSGIRHIAMDASRNRIYAVSFPRGDFHVYDMLTGRSTFKGRVNNCDSIARVMVIDDKGNVYGSFAPYRVFKYDIGTERLTDLPVTIPHMEGPWCDRGHFHRENLWRNAVWDPKERVIWGLEMGSATLFRFDPEKNSIKGLGQLVVKQYEGNRIVPYSSHGFALHPNGKIYYTAPTNRFQSAINLLSYELKTGEIRNLGELTDSRGAEVIDIEGASIAPDGSLFFAGWVKVPGVKGTQRGGTVMGLVRLKVSDLR